MSVRHRRQLVSRAEIIEALWSKDVFVDVETGVNTAVSKVRQALHDSADAAAFIETVPGKGYRFIASVAASHGSSDRPSPVKLAVLPFENIGHDPEREYLADGLTEERTGEMRRGSGLDTPSGVPTVMAGCPERERTSGVMAAFSSVALT